MKVRVTTEKIVAKATGVPATVSITWDELIDTWDSYIDAWDEWLPVVTSEIMKVRTSTEKINAKVI